MDLKDFAAIVLFFAILAILALIGWGFFNWIFG